MPRVTLHVLIIIFQILCSAMFAKDCNAQELKISKNGRYLTTQNGGTFLWIADTAWELFHKLDKEDAKFYLQIRKAQKFSVIQATILAEDDGLRKPNAYNQVPFIDLDPTRPNEAYFKHVDYIIETANKLKLTMAILPTWADKVVSDRPGLGPVVFDTNNAFIFGKFLGSRYKKSNVVWILGGDRNANEKSLPIWQAFAKGLKSGDGGVHLISYHPAGEQSSSAALSAEEWLDFNSYQSGHARKFYPVYNLAAKDYRSQPVKPFIDAEPCYEDIPVEFWKYMTANDNPDSQKQEKAGQVLDTLTYKSGFFNDYDVRVANYRNLFAGAFGISYGNNAVWQFYSKTEPAIIPCLFDWKESMNRPGALQVKNIEKFFRKIPLQSLVPNQAEIQNNFKEEKRYISAAKAGDKLLLYLPLGGEVEIPNARYYRKSIWFNPEKGTFSAGKKIESTKFSAPTMGIGNDWVLILF